MYSLLYMHLSLVFSFLWSHWQPPLTRFLLDPRVCSIDVACCRSRCRWPILQFSLLHSIIQTALAISGNETAIRSAFEFIPSCGISIMVSKLVTDSFIMSASCYSLKLGLPSSKCCIRQANTRQILSDAANILNPLSNIW